MTTIDRVRVALTGFTGAPGVCTFYSLDGPSMQGPLTTFFHDLVSILPTDVHYLVETNGDQIDAATGDLVGTWVGTTQTGGTGTQSGSYAAPVGLMCKWETGVIQDGSRVRGRTFIVPAFPSAFASDGTVESSVVSGIGTSCSNLVTATSPDFIVWHRPRAARAASGSLKALTSHVGTAVIVTGSSVSDTAVVLRSRRD